jgi:hypothetical protein
LDRRTVRCRSINDSATEVTVFLRSSEDRRGAAAVLSAITIIPTLT